MSYFAIWLIAFSISAIAAPPPSGLKLPQQQQPQTNLTRPNDPYVAAIPHTNFVLYLDRPGDPAPRDIPPNEVDQTIENGLLLVSLRFHAGDRYAQAQYEAGSIIPDPYTYVLLVWKHDTEEGTPTCTYQDLGYIWTKLRSFVGSDTAPPGIHGKEFSYRVKLENVQVGEGRLEIGRGRPITDLLGWSTGPGSNTSTARRSLE